MSRVLSCPKASPLKVDELRRTCGQYELPSGNVWRHGMQTCSLLPIGLAEEGLI